MANGGFEVSEKVVGGGGMGYVGDANGGCFGRRNHHGG